MPVTNFYSVNREIIGEKVAGGSRTDYLTDALGSVTGTLNQSAQVVNTYRYKPYGAQLAKTGMGPDPSFGWVGTQGYRKTNRKFSDFYVRARHYSSDEGRWTTKDPVGGDSQYTNVFEYAYSDPIGYTDPQGLQPANPGIWNCPPNYTGIRNALCGWIRRLPKDGSIERLVNQCLNQPGLTHCPAFTTGNLNDLRHSCGGCLSIRCNGSLEFWHPRYGGIYPCLRTPDCGWCIGGLPVIPFPPDYYPPHRINPCDDPSTCAQTLQGAGCPCTIVLCSDQIASGCEIDKNRIVDPVAGTMLHEMLYCSSIEHGQFPGYKSCNSRIACCLLKIKYPRRPEVNCKI